MPGSLEKEYLRKIQTTCLSHITQWDNVKNYFHEKESFTLSHASWNVLIMLRQFELEISLEINRELDKTSKS